MEGNEVLLPLLTINPIPNLNPLTLRYRGYRMSTNTIVAFRLFSSPSFSSKPKSHTCISVKPWRTWREALVDPLSPYNQDGGRLEAHAQAFLITLAQMAVNKGRHSKTLSIDVRGHRAKGASQVSLWTKKLQRRVSTWLSHQLQRLQIPSLAA